VARTVLLVGAAACLLSGVAGIGLAIAGSESLLSLLPPLAIDADALGGAVTAVALALVAVGVVHLGVLVGLGQGQRWAMSAGALLSSVLAVVSLALAAAAVSSALRAADYALPLIGAASLAFVATAAYAFVAVRLARELGSGSAS